MLARLQGAAERLLKDRPVFDRPPRPFPSEEDVARDLALDLTTSRIRRQGQDVPLTPLERDLLMTLVANRGQVVTREGLMFVVWGSDPRRDIRSRSMDVHLAHVRAKLGPPALFENVAGVGFRAVESVAIGGRDAALQRRRVRREQLAQNQAATEARVQPGTLPARWSARPGGR
jgi:DNA-binding response OmpR family regulator